MKQIAACFDGCRLSHYSKNIKSLSQTKIEGFKLQLLLNERKLAEQSFATASSKWFTLKIMLIFLLEIWIFFKIVLGRADVVSKN